jgi:hypothetical protein
MDGDKVKENILRPIMTIINTTTAVEFVPQYRLQSQLNDK